MSSFKIEIASFFVGRGARGAREVRGARSRGFGFQNLKL